MSNEGPCFDATCPCCKTMGAFIEKLEEDKEYNADLALQWKTEAERLQSAIKEHHSQKADDRCIEDDDRLYAAANLPPCDRRVGSKEEMLKNCARFIDRRCQQGHWPTYAELERKIADLKHLIWTHMPNADQWLDSLEK